MNLFPPLICHAPLTARRQGVESLSGLDVLELFAFVRPAQFCVPTPAGLAQFFNLPLTENILPAVAQRLLDELQQKSAAEKKSLLALLHAFQSSPWGWRPFLLKALEGVDLPSPLPSAIENLNHLPEWLSSTSSTDAPVQGIHPTHVRQRLAHMVSSGPRQEARPQQADYASAVSLAFADHTDQDPAKVILAEAGTGVGKTLGYLAPATLWAEQNGRPVWISTFTRHLQNQIEDELDRLYPDEDVKKHRVVVRKGRENYLCLLNLEEALRRLPMIPAWGTALMLMLRWAMHTRTGEVAGGDLPGWLPELVGWGRTAALADRRGECIHGACPHYKRCFVEHSFRRAKNADIVIANHALVMSQAAGGDLSDLPQNMVFDEGHHLFHAADSAFSFHLSGRETWDLRRWIKGPEGDTPARRARGLKRRLEDLVAENEDAAAALDRLVQASHILPADGWLQRLLSGQPGGLTEDFLLAVRRQVHATAAGQKDFYDLEAPLYPVSAAVFESAQKLLSALTLLHQSAQDVTRFLRRQMSRPDIAKEDAQRLEAATRSLDTHLLKKTEVWQSMLHALIQNEATPDFVDWLGVERGDGQDIDVAFHRHPVDPTKPFADTLKDHLKGLVVTSATLTDSTGTSDTDWPHAEAHTGARHFPAPATRAQVPSPFDYAKQTRVFVVTDVDRHSLDQVAEAYYSLFVSAGGGALGLFTAIQRLQAVHGRIARLLEKADLPLYAQHVDRADVATLVDIFRAEEHACLLGTDAMRDGVDVPGRSLRLIVFDRVPWPRPTLLHKARRNVFAKYDDSLTRLRLKQAYGRLVRRQDDTGVFVLLDRQFPSRLHSAFPPGVVIERITLEEAAAKTDTFLKVQH